MKVIHPSYEILTPINRIEVLKHIELCGRTCYKSEDKISEGSASKFVRGIIKRGHESALEHYSISVRVICDRGVSHEIVRHRIASYSQESTRYCNYTKEKFSNELTFIHPYYWYSDSEQYKIWLDMMLKVEQSYNTLIKLGAKPEEARSILPNSLKTELVMTMNLREWKHFFKLRVSEQAHPQMRELVCPMWEEFKEILPEVFELLF